MSRQSFVSTDFFLAASENESQALLSELPDYLPNLTLLKEHTLVHTTRFLYEEVEKGEKYYVDVSLLWLNDQYTRFNLHVTYTNGHAFSSALEINAVLHQFEKAVHAARVGEKLVIETKPPKPATSQRRSSALLNGLAGLFLSKYHY